MTQATDSSASATLSGRELALKRRKAMALHGKSGTANAASMRKPSARRVKPAPAATNTQVAASPAAASAAAASNYVQPVPARSTVESGARSVSRARRQAMSTSGKAALGSTTTARPSGRVRPQKAPAMNMASLQPAASAETAPAADTAKGCGCGCNGTKSSCGTTSVESVSERGSGASVVPSATTSGTAAAIPAMQASAPIGRALA